MSQPEPDDDAAPAGDDSADGDQGDETSTVTAPTSGPAYRPPAIVNQGAGWVLGLLVWGWVVLPFVKGGPAQVKKVWMAKFLNKAPDGSFLP